MSYLLGSGSWTQNKLPHPDFTLYSMPGVPLSAVTQRRPSWPALCMNGQGTSQGPLAGLSLCSHLLLGQGASNTLPPCPLWSRCPVTTGNYDTHTHPLLEKLVTEHRCPALLRMTTLRLARLFGDQKQVPVRSWRAE